MTLFKLFTGVWS